jgi:hypothetical protein
VLVPPASGLAERLDHDRAWNIKANEPPAAVLFVRNPRLRRVVVRAVTARARRTVTVRVPRALLVVRRLRNSRALSLQSVANCNRIATMAVRLQTRHTSSC